VALSDHFFREAGEGAVVSLEGEGGREEGGEGGRMSE
jgi:hypothetical protein